MSDPATEARRELWAWLAHDRELGGAMLDACAATGLLGADEVAALRAAFAGEPVPRPAGADAAAARRHVEELRAALRPMSRDEDPEALRASWRHTGALEALGAAGVVDETDVAQGWTLGLTASAPWLDAEEAAEMIAGDGAFAVAIPPRTPQEAAEDAAREEEWARLAVRGELVDVLVPDLLDRHDGVVVVAALLRTESVELRLHHVEADATEPQPGHAELRALDARAGALVPPALHDEHGTAYAPVLDRPLALQSSGGVAGVARRVVTTGTWRYLPAAPVQATTLTATLGAVRWTLR